MRRSNLIAMRLSDTKGSTLIELMTAIFVLAVALVGALALTTSNVRNQGLGVSRLLAVNLAREGIEVARNLRDTNWLAERAWDLYLPNAVGEGRLFACGVLSNASASLEANQNPFVISDPTCSIATATETFQVYRSGKGGYYQINSSGDPVPNVYRTIRFDSLCIVNNVEQKCENAQQQKIGVAVSAKVTWEYGGRNREVELAEKLYNWR
jgi:type II secretory pathway pseudopilin PulG